MTRHHVLHAVGVGWETSSRCKDVLANDTAEAIPAHNARIAGRRCLVEQQRCSGRMGKMRNRCTQYVVEQSHDFEVIAMLRRRWFTHSFIVVA